MNSRSQSIAPSAPHVDPVPSAPRGKWLLYVAAVIGVLAAVRCFPIQDLLKRALDWVDTLGAWGPVIFGGIYIVSTVLLLPGSVLTLGAGAVFGLPKGMVIVSLASTSAATVAFLIGRHLARATVARKLEANAKFAALDQAVAAEGWKIVLLTRLSPVFPFTLLNYAFGLTQVRLSHYVVASWVGMLPGTVMYVYLSSLAQVGASQRARTPGEWGLYGVGLLATAAVTLLVTRIARKALAGKLSA
jgi:uncharacterized membrane protein YdjX (TVP38/TMEM64 family)